MEEWSDLPSVERWKRLAALAIDAYQCATYGKLPSRVRMLHATFEALEELDRQEAATPDAAGPKTPPTGLDAPESP